MIKLFRVLILIFVIILINRTGFSQLNVSYYSSTHSKIGLGYDFGDKLLGELRIYSNRTIKELTPEIVACYGIVKKENQDIYLGLGVYFDYFRVNGFVLPLMIQFSPIKEFDRFSLIIELQPTLDVFTNDLIINSSWGLKYKFGRRN